MSVLAYAYYSPDFNFPEEVKYHLDPSGDFVINQSVAPIPSTFDKYDVCTDSDWLILPSQSLISMLNLNKSDATQIAIKQAILKYDFQ